MSERSSKRKAGSRERVVKRACRSATSQTGLRAPRDSQGKSNHKSIFVVDPAQHVGLTVYKMLASDGYRYRRFSTADECLAGLRRTHCDLIVADVDMKHGISREFLARVRQFRPHLPVVAITQCKEIRGVVHAMKNGASHVLTAPVSKKALHNVIVRLLCEMEPRRDMMPDNLTEAEKDILGLVLSGHSNTRIAGIMGKSIRTVEDQRRQVMRKMNADSIVDLVRKSIALGIIRLPEYHGDHYFPSPTE
jgi:two-component system, chemotaxis family, CheB/CheR fusion protein